MTERPMGTVTFLFADLVGSTRLWEQHPEAMKAALSRHDDVLRTAVETNRGQVVKSTGDGCLAAFTTAVDALVAAVDAQRALNAEPWGATGPLRVRIGVHTGEIEVGAGGGFAEPLSNTNFATEGTPLLLIRNSM